MDEIKNILNSADKLSEEQLLNYLRGEASAKEQHAVERSMNDSAFVHDAVEGLQALHTGTNLNEYILQLNKKLHEQLAEKKELRRKRSVANFSWILIAVISILLLCIMGFVVLKMFS
jgi:anti-sigma factor RsiW